MRILFVGEIVAEPGRDTVKEVLPEVKKEFSPDIIISNVENLAGGRGITEDTLRDMQMTGVDFFTGGDHIFWQRNTDAIIDKFPLVRPANYPEGTALGEGYKLVDTGKAGKILIINLMGRTSFGSLMTYLDDPFKKFDAILDEFSDNMPEAVFVDFHAESTSEKVAFGFYVDGRATAVVGTHTHIPSADPRILPEGTLFITDAGMTGNIDSVLGVNKEIIIKLHLTAQSQRFEWEKTGTKAFRSVLLDTSTKSIERIDKNL